MIQRGVKLQLIVFTLVSILATGYALVRFAGLKDILDPPFTVKAQFAQSGGIYPRADVDLLGTSVGSVSSVGLGNDGRVTVTMSLKQGTRIPIDVTAAVAERSALGEQFVELVPRSAGAPYLHGGSVIPVSRTQTPIPVENLLGDLSALAGSIPTGALHSDLSELATAFQGGGPALQHLLDDSDTITRAALANLSDLTSLIDSSARVLRTQVASGTQITALSADLAGLTTALRAIDPTFAQTFANGIQAGQQITSLLAANASALPQFLNSLLVVTSVADPRLPGLRKTLVVFPYALDGALGAIRYCDDTDPKTGAPIRSSCHLDAEGQPLWSEHFAVQLPEIPGTPQYGACTNGYQSTTKYFPNGQPASGSGAREPPTAPANSAARCTAGPTNPTTPNVRGAQNVQLPGTGVALYDPNTGDLVSSDGRAYRITCSSPPHGADSLAWLLASPLSPKPEQP